MRRSNNLAAADGNGFGGAVCWLILYSFRLYLL
jgi:hypothetical protein